MGKEANQASLPNFKPLLGNRPGLGIVGMGEIFIFNQVWCFDSFIRLYILCIVISL